MKLPRLTLLFANDSEEAADPDPDEAGRAYADCEIYMGQFLREPALHAPVINGGRCILRPRGKNLPKPSQGKAKMIKTLIRKLGTAKEGLLTTNVPKPVGSRRTRMSPDVVIDAWPLELSSGLGSKLDGLGE